MPEERLINQQIRTRKANSRERTLVTELVEAPVPDPGPRDLLVEVLFVPIHGSFWLASHPSGLHPRYHEFLQEGEFVFGNGGVGRVLAVGEESERARTGDLVSIMGHLPCGDPNCHGCGNLERFTECDFGRGTVLGHGKGGPDGTFARYCILPEIACEVCFDREERPPERDVLPYMFGFLMADVRNALTRDPDTLSGQSMLLVGAGFSGLLAAWLFLHSSPGARILAVDPLPHRLARLVDLDTDAIRAIGLPGTVAESLEASPSNLGPEPEVMEFAAEVAGTAHEHFQGHGCGLVFDASSGNSTPLWANSHILRPGSHCIPFGFGSRGLVLDPTCLQVSGLKLLTSRGVGNSENRRAALELIRSAASGTILDSMVGESARLNGLEEAMEFIREHQAGRSGPLSPPSAYLVPNRFSLHD